MRFLSFYPNGYISRVIDSSSRQHAEQYLLPNENIVESLDGNTGTHYVQRDTTNIPIVILRPTMSPRWNNTPLRSDGQDVTLLLDLPDPCRVIYEGPGFRHEGEVVGGVAEFTTDVTGPHKVTVRAWPYLDWTEEFDAI